MNIFVKPEIINKANASFNKNECLRQRKSQIARINNAANSSKSVVKKEQPFTGSYWIYKGLHESSNSWVFKKDNHLNLVLLTVFH